MLRTQHRAAYASSHLTDLHLKTLICIGHNNPRLLETRQKNPSFVVILNKSNIAQMVLTS